MLDTTNVQDVIFELKMSDMESDISDEEFHVPRLNEDASDGDSDKELQVAYASGLLKPGLVRPITAPAPVINNLDGLKQKLEEIKQTNLEWIERLDVTVQPHNNKENNADEVEDGDTDVHNDFQREITFYEQAKSAVIFAMKRLHGDGVKTKRPEDYFAEMAKKDDHMKKVREKLLALQRQRETAEKNKTNFKLRKYGKQVQHSVTIERHQKKKELLKSVKKYRKGQTKSLDFLDEPDDKQKGGKKLSQLQKLQQQKKLNPKRASKNKKYGFGGKKRGMKRNNNKSANDVSGFKKHVHSKKNTQRPGKNRRVQMRNRNK
uniref:Probable rRNA-processing protein EBP2 n=1 Tax=Phallusia mammillata TaxID=59560 RepID=A0A6F9DAU4_9ASCI|nr:probable rRNA-processing protein EBP2 [Phallusia mammillata]